MAEYQSAPGSDEVQIRPAIRIDQMLSRAALNEERRAADGLERAHRRIDASGNDPAGALVQLCGTGICAHCGSSNLRWSLGDDSTTSLVSPLTIGPVRLNRASRKNASTASALACAAAARRPANGKCARRRATVEAKRCRRLR